MLSRLQVTNLRKRLSGRILFLLIGLIVLDMLAPLLEQGELISRLYVYAYCIVLGVGVFIGSSSRYRFQIGIGGAVITTMLIMRSSLSPDNEFLAIVALAVLVIFQVFIITVMIEFMFLSRTVDREVLFASIVIYLLIANTYAPLYSILQRLQNGEAYQFAYIEASGADWPQFLYFSFATITTLGFGDIAPVSPMAGMLTISEAVVGVLYLTMMMARLVGLYATNDGDE